MLDLLIKNCTVITMNDARDVLENAYIAVKDGKIVSVGVEEPKEAASRVMDAGGKIAMPGLINIHTHSSMSLMRGFADDYVLQDWLQNYVFPTEAKLVASDVYLGSMLTFAEMLSTGTIAMTDMYMHLPQMARAAQDAGVYSNFSNSAMCFDPSKYCYETDGVTQQNREVIARFHNADQGRLKLDASIHAEYTSFPQLWQDFAAFARENNLNMHVHVSETKKEQQDCIDRYGKTPTQILCDNGVFDTRATAAHCVWATEEDMDIYIKKGVTVAHNPVSNLKLASGVAPVARMLEKGVRVGLGTDGVCSNNNHDMFEEIKTAALLQKGVTGDPRVVPAHQALYMATRAGAYAQGRENQIGQLTPGFDASLILLDTDRPGLTPVNNPESTAAYSATGGDVCMTMIRGKVLYENGVFTTIDMEKIRAELKPVLNRLLRS